MSFEDRYQLQVPLGETDRGTVWSGKDKKFGRNVAIAVVEDDADPEILARFTAVNEAAMAIRHPAIVRVHEVGMTGDDAPFATMELLEGEALRARLVDGPPLRLDQAVRAIAEILTGLGKLHAANQAHGDVSPSNIIVRERAGRVVAKLVGLGLDRARVRAGKDALDHESQLFGLAFMSPAQARGEVVADAASDIYSAAAVLYALMTGHPPHYGDSEEALRADVINGPVWPTANHRHEIAGPVADLVTKALGDEPFATADDLAKELRGSLLRMRGVGKLETVAGALPTVRPAEAPPEAPASEVKPIRPLKKLNLGGPAGAKPFAGKPVIKKKEESAAAENDEALGFERLSGLLEIPKGEGPPKRLPPAPPKEDEELEFERLSGLIEVPIDGSPPKRRGPAPPPPPKADAEEADEKADDEESEGEEDVDVDVEGETDADDEAGDETESAAGEGEEAASDTEAGEEAPLEDGDEEPGDADEEASDDDAEKAADEEAEEPEAEESEAEESETKESDAGDSEAEAAAGASDDGESVDADSGPDEPDEASEGAEADAAAGDADEASTEPSEEGSDEAAAAAGGEAPSAGKKKKKKRPSKRPSKRPKKTDSESPPAALAPPEPEKTQDRDPFTAVAKEVPAEPVDEGGGIPIWVWGAVAAAVLIGIIAFAMSGGETAETDPEPTATLPDDPPHDPVPDIEESDVEEPDIEEPDIEEPAVADPTFVTLADVPEGATVWLDGVEIEGIELEIPADDATHDVEVRLEGHVTWTASVDATNEQELTVVLEPEATQEPDEPVAANPPTTSDTPPSGRRGSRRGSGETSGRRRGSTTTSGRRRGGTTSGRRGRGSPTAVTDPGF